MWRNRYDDLWLYPVPNWFIRFCERTIGVYVLDLMLLSTVCGLGFTVIGGLQRHGDWPRYLGFLLISPAALFVLMTIVTSLYRNRRRSLESRKQHRQARIYEALNALTADPSAVAGFESSIQALVWSDELPMDDAVRKLVIESESFRKALMYRKSVTLGKISEGEDDWRKLERESPAWPGLRGDRRDDSARRQLEVEMSRSLRHR